MTGMLNRRSTTHSISSYSRLVDTEFTELVSMEVQRLTEDGSASVMVSMAGSEAEIVITLRRGERDPWFVHQIVALGGDIDQIPWAVPEESR